MVVSLEYDLSDPKREGEREGKDRGREGESGVEGEGEEEREMVNEKRKGKPLCPLQRP